MPESSDAMHTTATVGALPLDGDRITVRSPDEILAMEFDSEDRYLLDGILSKGQPMTLIGPGGVGKSRLLLQLAAAMVSGRDFIGIQVPKRRRRWLFLQAENSDRRLNDDLGKINEWIGPKSWPDVAECLVIRTLDKYGDGFLNLDDPRKLIISCGKKLRRCGVRTVRCATEHPLWRVREVLENSADYASAYNMITEKIMTSPAFFLICGKEPGESCLVMRDGANQEHVDVSKCETQAISNHVPGGDLLENDFDDATSEERFDAMYLRAEAMHTAEINSAKRAIGEWPVECDRTVQQMVLCPAKNELHLRCRNISDGYELFKTTY